MHTDLLLSKQRVISDQVSAHEIRIILGELEKLLMSGRRGAVVELGCYVGTTSLFLRRLLDAYDPAAEFHVYDSFAGLPEKDAHDQSPAGMQFVKGELSARKKDFIMNFKSAQLRLPTIHKAWFSDLTSNDMPEDILFAYLDGDYYQSIKDSLRVIETKLQPAAVILVDDYANEALPGAAKAVNEWLVHRPHTLQVVDSIAIIRLQ